MGMGNWMTMAGAAAMLMWLGPTCTAMAQCGSSCGTMQHSQGQQTERPAEPSNDGGASIAKLPSCPVMGESVDFNVETMTDEGSVYFCCGGCVQKYQKDPEKYAKKTAEQRKALKKMKRVQVNCPVTGEPIDGKTFAIIKGQGVSFCCKECVENYERDPAKYRAKLEASYTYQVRCPVMGGEIDPTAFTDLPTGERIYFCCKGCENKLLKDREKYAPKLAEQGVNIDTGRVSGKSADRSHAEKEDDHKGHDHP